MNHIDIPPKRTSFLQGQEREIVASYIRSYIRPLKNKSIYVDQRKVRFIEGGSGPTVLLLHGIGSTKNHFRSLMIQLSKNYHVIAPEIPGFQPSLRLQNKKHNWRNLCEWLSYFVEAINIKECVLVGVSISASLATYYTNKYPEKVTKLCLLSFPETFDQSGTSIRNTVEELFANASSTDDIDRLIRICFYYAPSLPGIVKKKILRDILSNQAFLKELFKDIGDSHIQILPRLSQINKPTLILSGSNDPICPPEFAETLDRLIPNSESHIIHYSNHLTFLEKHKIVFPLIECFLNNDR